MKEWTKAEKKFHFTASFIIFDSIIRFIGGNAITLTFFHIYFHFIIFVLFSIIFIKCKIWTFFFVFFPHLSRTKKMNQPENHPKIKNVFHFKLIGVRDDWNISSLFHFIFCYFQFLYKIKVKWKNGIECDEIHQPKNENKKKSNWKSSHWSSKFVVSEIGTNKYIKKDDEEKKLQIWKKRNMKSDKVLKSNLSIIFLCQSKFFFFFLSQSDSFCVLERIRSK